MHYAAHMRIWKYSLTLLFSLRPGLHTLLFSILQVDPMLFSAFQVNVIILKEQAS